MSFKGRSCDKDAGHGISVEVSIGTSDKLIVLSTGTQYYIIPKERLTEEQFSRLIDSKNIEDLREIIPLMTEISHFGWACLRCGGDPTPYLTGQVKLRNSYRQPN